MKEGATPPPMDFFNGVVLKARGAESGIAPRLPSLFEPVAGVAMAPMDAIEEQVAAARDLQDASPESRGSRSPVAHALRPLAPGLVDALAQGAELDPMEHDLQGRSAEAALVATLQPVPVVTRLSGGLATRRDEQQPEGTPAFDVMRTDETDLGRTQESGHEASRIGEPKEGRQESGVLIPKPAAVPVPYPSQREAPGTGSATARDLTSSPPMAEQPAPVINVTIGRVEVRAVQAPAGKPRIDPSKPKPLSLDDYLKQRGGNR